MIRLSEVSRDIKIGICDDNSTVRKQVLTWIADNRNDINPHNIREFVCGEAVLDYLRHDVIDILILDCKMDGIDGIQTAMQIRKTNRRMVIVALTDYKGYALYGYDAEIYRYILKSEFTEKMADAFSGAIHQYSTDTVPTLSLKTLKGMVYIPLVDIMYIESTSRIKHCVLFTGDTYSTYGKNSEIESLLNQHGFIHPHNSYFLNSRYVIGFEKEHVRLRNGQAIPISKGRRKAAFDALTLYLSETKT